MASGRPFDGPLVAPAEHAVDEWTHVHHGVSPRGVTTLVFHMLQAWSRRLTSSMGMSGISDSDIGHRFLQILCIICLLCPTLLTPTCPSPLPPCCR